MATSRPEYNVLVLEDEPSLENAIKLKLASAGVKVTTMESGKEALDQIKTQDIHYDGIWLDFDILGMNGLEFMREFITVPGWERIPVLIVSNTGNPDLISQTIELGAKEWIIKAEVRLDDTVSRFLEIIDQAKKT